MSELKKVLEIQGLSSIIKQKEKHFRLIVSGRKSIQLFSNWIYNNKGLYLKRKFESFKQEKIDINELTDREQKRTKEAATVRKEKFLIEYRKNNCITETCNKVGIRESTFKNWIRSDYDFRTQFHNLK